MPNKDFIRASELYENYIAEHGISEQVINGYTSLVSSAFGENDIPFALKISQRVKVLIERFCIEKCDKKDIKISGMWDWEKMMFRANLRNQEETLIRYYEILRLEAQNMILDSYLMYLEKKREPEERFYMPKRKQFLKIEIIQALQDMLDDKLDLLTISLPPGTGKAGRMDSKVLTPNGWKIMRDIKIGDKVISGTGKISNVLGVYPQGKKPCYEVIFDDGSKTVCSDEHLWKVQTRDDRNKRLYGENGRYRVIELKEIISKLYVENGKRKNYSIDYVPKIEFEERKLKIEPYLLGVILGDGAISQKNIRITLPDEEILGKIKTILPSGYELRQRTKYDWDITSNQEKNIIKTYLSEYGLMGHKSTEKFIPKDYLYASYNHRLELLRGLLDTDGHADKRGYYIEYSTSSKQLSQDVAELVHSLGGYASISKKNKTGYRSTDGDFIECNAAYRICIQFSSCQPTPFYLSRKKAAYRPKRNVMKRFITEVRYTGEEECQCIYIDDESHLYITDDYIITHNTTLSKFFISGVIGWFPKDFNLFWSHSGEIATKYYKGCLDIVTNNVEYTWNEIFPELSVTYKDAKAGEFNVGKYKAFASLQTTSNGAENAGKVRADKFLMIDDLIGKLEEALNKNILDKLWSTYGVDAKQRKTTNLEGKRAKEIHIATRWSTMDPIGHLQLLYGDNPRCKFIAVPDIDEETGESNFDYEFQGLDVEYFNDQALTMDDVSYRCLFKNQPIEREGLLYAEDSVERYSELPKGEPEEITGQCDHKGSGTDFMFMFAAYKYSDWYYIEDVVCNRNPDYGIQYQDLTNLIINNKMQNAFFESNQGGDRVALEVEKRTQAEGWICNITSIPTETNKEARIYQYANWIKQHCKFKDKSKYSAKSDYATMMNQLFTYSVSGKNPNDDIPDALAIFARNKTKNMNRRQTVIMSSPI